MNRRFDVKIDYFYYVHVKNKCGIVDTTKRNPEVCCQNILYYTCLEATEFCKVISFLAFDTLRNKAVVHPNGVPGI